MKGLYIANNNITTGTLKDIELINNSIDGLFHNDKLYIEIIKQIITNSKYQHIVVDIPGCSISSIEKMFKELFYLSRERYILIKDSHFRIGYGITLVTEEILKEFKSWYINNSDFIKTDFNFKTL